MFHSYSKNAESFLFIISIYANDPNNVNNTKLVYSCSSLFFLLTRLRGAGLHPSKDTTTFTPNAYNYTLDLFRTLDIPLLTNFDKTTVSNSNYILLFESVSAEI